MKPALQTFATLEDLEQLLETYPKPRGQASHYGVIDANGGTAYYEVNNWTWAKFDANDEGVAPNGYIIRTKYSKSGTKYEAYGFVRRESAEIVLQRRLNIINWITEQFYKEFPIAPIILCLVLTTG